MRLLQIDYNPERRKSIPSLLTDFMTIQNIFVIEKTVYKEKLRVCSYGLATSDSTVFVELKRKYRRLVYKRRVAMEEQAEDVMVNLVDEDQVVIHLVQEIQMEALLFQEERYTLILVEMEWMPMVH